MDISANVMGRVTRLSEGSDVVKAGQFLLEIDPSRFQASTQGLQAGVEAAESDLAESGALQSGQIRSARAEANRKAGIISRPSSNKPGQPCPRPSPACRPPRPRDQAKAGVREVVGASTTPPSTAPWTGWASSAHRGGRDRGHGRPEQRGHRADHRFGHEQVERKWKWMKPPF